MFDLKVSCFTVCIKACKLTCGWEIISVYNFEWWGQTKSDLDVGFIRNMVSGIIYVQVNRVTNCLKDHYNVTSHVQAALFFGFHNGCINWQCTLKQQMVHDTRTTLTCFYLLYLLIMHFEKLCIRCQSYTHTSLFYHYAVCGVSVNTLRPCINFWKVLAISHSRSI